MKAVLVVSFFFLFSTSAFSDFQGGRDAYDRKDYPTALKELQPSAEEGDEKSQYLLGWLYDNGYGVTEDDQTAMQWYRLAADQGQHGAQFQLGWMYEQGNGADQDYEAALKWYRLAAEQGHGGAQYNLGALYAYGNGLDQNYEAALKWYKLAAEQGHSGAQFILGWMYEKGNGADQDYKAALKWYRLAAEQGQGGAQYNLGWMYEQGNGADQDYKAAIKWYRLAAEQGRSDAQFKMGWMYEQGNGVDQNHLAALKWFSLAAEQGHGVAQNNLGALYADGRGITQDYVRSHIWLDLATARGSSQAAKNLDNLRNLMTPADISKAEELARECAAKDYTGCSPEIVIAFTAGEPPLQTQTEPLLCEDRYRSGLLDGHGNPPSSPLLGLDVSIRTDWTSSVTNHSYGEPPDCAAAPGNCDERERYLAQEYDRIRKIVSLLPNVDWASGRSSANVVLSLRLNLIPKRGVYISTRDYSKTGSYTGAGVEGTVSASIVEGRLAIREYIAADPIDGQLIEVPRNREEAPFSDAMRGGSHSGELEVGVFQSLDHCVLAVLGESLGILQLAQAYEHERAKTARTFIGELSWEALLDSALATLLADGVGVSVVSVEAQRVLLDQLGAPVAPEAYSSLNVIDQPSCGGLNHLVSRPRNPSTKASCSVVVEASAEVCRGVGGLLAARLLRRGLVYSWRESPVLYAYVHCRSGPTEGDRISELVAAVELSTSQMYMFEYLPPIDTSKGKSSPEYTGTVIPEPPFLKILEDRVEATPR